MQEAEINTGELHIQKGAFQKILVSDDGFVGIKRPDKFNLKIITLNYLHRFALFS